MADKEIGIQKEITDEKNRALSKAMKLCSGQEKCIADVRKKLHDWEVSSEHHDYVIHELIKDKFIDENRYAAAFVNDKFRFSKWGKIKIVYALKGKKIASAIINEALANIEDQIYLQFIEKEIKIKQKSVKNTDKFEVKVKLFRFAQSKGFEAELALQIINKILKTN